MTIFKGPQELEAEVILASRPDERPDIAPLVTIRLRYPRIVHGEIMTHRDFSRNARSSRAVPVMTMLNEVNSSPFVPWHWGKNQRGMQADVDHNDPVIIPEGYEKYWDFDTPISREDAWLYARDRAVEVANAMMNANYHKQIPNRLLEPFSWIDTLITSNRWDNFLWLRDEADAEPHIQDLARLVNQALNEMPVQELLPHDWHLPYITDADNVEAMTVAPKHRQQWLCKISAARCARISYKPFDGDASYQRELERHDMLVTSKRVHASPLEHQARPDPSYGSMHLHGNLPGWIQYRKTVPNEVHRTDAVI